MYVKHLELLKRCEYLAGKLLLIP